MFKKIVFAAVLFSTFIWAYSLENEPFPKMEKVSADSQFRYLSFGTYRMFIPTVYCGIRDVEGRQGNDWAVSLSYFPYGIGLALPGIGVQYSRLFYFGPPHQSNFYCGVGPDIHFFPSVGHLEATGIGLIGYQFKTQKRTHFLEFKGNMPIFYQNRFYLARQPHPTFSYGLSF